MPKCYAQKNLLTCDLTKGHDGPHRDEWILGAGHPAPNDRYVEWDQMEPVPPVAETSASVGVTCSACGKDLGAQYRPGDGMALFKAHIPDCPFGGEPQ